MSAESLPFTLSLPDYMHNAVGQIGRAMPLMQPLKRKISDYMKENMHVTK